MEPKYKRILLKVSGEALAGEQKNGLNYNAITSICASIKKVVDAGVQVAIVVGGGNFWRGRSSGAMDRTRADHIGMLATAMNALAVADVLESLGCEVRVQTAISMQQVAEPYIRNRAVRHLEKGRVVIFGCGTGNPFFSTDTAASLRAVEIGADIYFKATLVDGVYDKDPHKFDDAQKYDTLTFTKVMSDGLAVMDSTAAAMCHDNNMKMLVFDLTRPDNIYDAVMGKNIERNFIMKDTINNSKEKMTKSLAALDKELATIRAGRANPAILDKVQVDYYGSPTPVNQMASIAVSEARILVIQPWDKSCLKLIEKAIQASDIGINPTNDGSVLRLAFPQLTEERRKELCKSVKKMGEDSKVAIRSIRRDTMDKLKAMKKNSEITEDDLKDCEKKVQDLTDKFCAEADQTVAAKEKEIMTV